ncbi:MAG: hypothetical protein JNM76_06470 [Betaproteobacteria bacterium]|nr:hypothetical protein [Betaproteobacteria bacterium]
MFNAHSALRAATGFACLLVINAVHMAHAAAADIEVMVLGSYHMANPGRDVVNSKTDDVTTPARQQQLADVARRLAAFKPTKIVVEMVPDGEGFTVPAYRDFTPEKLMQDRSEITQIAYRLAHQLGHREVYAIDEKSKTIDYFPYGKVQEYAKSTGRDAELGALMGGARVFAKDLETRQATQTVAQLLAHMNEPATIRGAQKLYTGMLRFGGRESGERWPGAELNAAWYLRNAKIFSKLTRIVEPGDRVVVLFGAGHSYQLREFVASTNGFRLIEPNAFLLP